MSDTKKPPTFITGLVKDAYIKGSWHSAPAPSLTKADVEESTGKVDFELTAHGSGTYKITVKGEIRILDWERR